MAQRWEIKRIGSNVAVLLVHSLDLKWGSCVFWQGNEILRGGNWFRYYPYSVKKLIQAPLPDTVIAGVLLSIPRWALPRCDPWNVPLAWCFLFSDLRGAQQRQSHLPIQCHKRIVPVITFQPHPSDSNLHLSPSISFSHLVLFLIPAPSVFVWVSLCMCLFLSQTFLSVSQSVCLSFSLSLCDWRETDRQTDRQTENVTTRSSPV